MLFSMSEFAGLKKHLHMYIYIKNAYDRKMSAARGGGQGISGIIR